MSHFFSNVSWHMHFYLKLSFLKKNTSLLDSFKIIKLIKQLKCPFRKNELDIFPLPKPAIFGWWNMFNWIEFQHILAHSYETDTLERSQFSTFFENSLVSCKIFSKHWTIKIKTTYTSTLHLLQLNQHGKLLKIWLLHMPAERDC